MKKLFFILSILLPIIAYNQDTSDIEDMNDITVYGNAYRYLKAYQDNKPFLSTTFVFEKIIGDQFYNAYDILSTEAKVKKKVLRYGIWMVETDSNFYINIMRYGYADMFIKFEKTNNYYYFKAPPRLPAMQRNTNENMYLLGITGAAVNVALQERKRPKYLYAVLDFDNDVVNFLTKEYIEKLLNNYTDLKNDFNNEKEREDIEILKLYLERINNEYKTSAITSTHNN